MVDMVQTVVLRRAMLIIEGLTLAYWDCVDPEEFKKLIDDMYAISHVANGRCANPHVDWLARMHEIELWLTESKIINVQRAMKGEWL